MDRRNSIRQECVPQAAVGIELCLRLTNGKPALARWIGDGSSGLAKCKVLAPLLVARAMDDQFDTGNVLSVLF